LTASSLLQLMVWQPHFPQLHFLCVRLPVQNIFQNNNNNKLRGFTATFSTKWEKNIVFV
jgi:hypothetical protein